MRAWLIASVLFSPAAVVAADVPAAKDALRPFAGSELIAQDYRANDELDLQTSTFRDYSLSSKKRLYAEPPLHLSGAHSTRWYQANGYASAAEVMNHYRAELTARGFAVLYDSSADPAAKKSWSNGFLAAYEESTQLSAKGRWAFNGADSQSVRTLTAKREDAQGGVYVSLVAVEWPEDVGAYEAKRGAYVALDVIESKAPRTVSDPLASTIASSGHAALYDLTFEGDKPRSVARIRALLESEPALKLHVVVHTDNSAGLEASLALSRRRAKAIVGALEHEGIAAARLSAEGVGPLAPVASNATEEGRARNRRVELVAQ